MRPTAFPIRTGYTLLGLAALTLALELAQAEEFWKQKPPAQWRFEEALRLLQKSPWAHQEEVAMPWRRRATGVRTLVLPPPYPGAATSDPLARRQRTQRPETIIYDAARYLVRWESAAPVREAFARMQALGEQTSADFQAPPPRWPDDRYVITVKMLRPPERGRDPFERIGDRQLRVSARLKTPQGEVAPLEVERSGLGATAALHFFFPRMLDGEPWLGPRPARVEFKLELRRTSLKSKFTLDPDWVR